MWAFKIFLLLQKDSLLKSPLQHFVIRMNNKLCHKRHLAHNEISQCSIIYFHCDSLTSGVCIFCWLFLTAVKMLLQHRAALALGLRMCSTNVSRRPLQDTIRPSSGKYDLACQMLSANDIGAPSFTFELENIVLAAGSGSVLSCVFRVSGAVLVARCGFSPGSLVSSHNLNTCMWGE